MITVRQLLVKKVLAVRSIAGRHCVRCHCKDGLSMTSDRLVMMATNSSELSRSAIMHVVSCSKARRRGYAGS